MGAPGPTGQELFAILALVGAMLLAGRLLGAVAHRLGQAAFCGELVAGFLLGPSVFGVVSWSAGGGFFPLGDGDQKVIQGLFWLSALLLVLSGFLDGFGRLPKTLLRGVLLSSIGGIVACAIVSVATVFVLPDLLAGGYLAPVSGAFLGAAFLVSDVPSVSRLLREHRLSKTDVALLSVAQASLTGLLAWVGFSLAVGIFSAGWTTPTVAKAGLSAGLVVVAGFAVRRRAARRLFARLEKLWPDAFFPFTVVLSVGCLLGALTEWSVGHALAGAALAGWTVGTFSKLPERNWGALEGITQGFASPLLFAYVGSSIDVSGIADPLRLVGIIILVVAVGSVARIVGTAAGAWGGRIAWADAVTIGIAGSVRGGAGTLAAFLGYSAGIIEQELFLGLVFLSIASSGLAGTFLGWSLTRRQRLDFRLFREVVIVGQLQGHSRREVIRELVVEMGQGSDLGDRELIINALLEREDSMPTGLPNGLAIPHARLPGVERPYLAIGRSPAGVDFDSPDGLPAKLIFLLLSSERDEGVQLQALATIARAMNDPERRDRLLDAKDTNELLMHFEDVFQG